MIGPLRDLDNFGPQDFEALFNYESTERIQPAIKAAEDMNLLSKSYKCEISLFI